MKIGISALFLLFNIVYAQETIAVIDFSADGISESEAKTLTNRFRFELFNSGKYQVIEREMMEEILTEQGIQQSGCLSTECIIELGNLIGVKQIIGGNVGSVGNIYSVSIRLIDVETGVIKKIVNYDHKGDIGDLLISGMSEIVTKFTTEEKLPEKELTFYPTLADRAELLLYNLMSRLRKNKIKKDNAVVSVTVENRSRAIFNVKNAYRGNIGTDAVLKTDSMDSTIKIYEVIPLKIPFREGPDTSFKIIRYLYQFDSVIMLDSSNYWSRVEHYDKQGYVYSEFLNPNDSTDIASVRGWYDYPMYTGQSSDCIKLFKRFPVKIDNYLKLNLNIESDVVLLLVNNFRNSCIRSIYIESGDTYYIRNIPEGIYYLKIYYGNELIIKNVAEKCFIKFKINPQLEITQPVFDFNLIPHGMDPTSWNSYRNLYKVPMYEYSIHVKGKDLNLIDK